MSKKKSPTVRVRRVTVKNKSSNSHIEHKWFISSGIPIPERKARKSRNDSVYRQKIYPFKYMNAGDSFLFSKTNTREAQMAGYTSANAWRTKVAPDRKFIARQTKAGIRVWRIK